MESRLQNGQASTSCICRLSIPTSAQCTFSGIRTTTPSRVCRSLSSRMWCFGDGPHPFWYCLFAAHVWTTWIDHFWPLFDYFLDWRSVLRFHVELSPAAQRAYGYSLFLRFFILFEQLSFDVSGAIGMIYDSMMLQQTFSGFRLRSTLLINSYGVVFIHLASRSLRHSSLTLLQHNNLLSDLHI